MEPNNRQESAVSLIKCLSSALRLSYNNNPRLLLAWIALALAGGALPFVSVYCNAQFLGTIANIVALTGPGSELLPKALFWLGALILTAMAIHLVGQATEVVQHLHTSLIGHRAQGLVAVTASKLPLEELQSPEALNKIQLAQNEASHRPSQIIGHAIQLTTVTVTVALFCATIFTWMPWMLCLLVITPLVTWWTERHISRKRLAMSLRNVETERKARYYRSMLTSDAAAKEVRVYQLQSYFLKRWEEAWRYLRGQEKQLSLYRFLVAGVGGMLLISDRVIFIGFCIYQVAEGKIDFAQFSLYIQSMLGFQQSLKGFGVAHAKLGEAAHYASRVFWLVESIASRKRPQDYKFSVQSESSTAPHFEFRNVSFRYSGTKRYVIKNLSFRLCKGDSLAITGLNGSGKTTLIKLASGLYKPTEGSVTINGHELYDMNEADKKNLIGVLFQDPHLFNVTMRDNLVFDGDETILEDVLRITRLTDLRERLVHGSNTLLGKLFVPGQELSHGQRQMVGIGRALARKPELLVYDEPLTALDTNNRVLVYDIIFGEYLREVTKIIACHDKESIERATHVLHIGSEEEKVHSL